MLFNATTAGKRFLFGAIFSLVFCFGVQAEEVLPAEFEGVGITEKIGQRLPEDLIFLDSEGHSVQFGRVIHDIPTILTFGYFTCPLLCNLILDGLTDGLTKSGLVLGKDYRIVSVSIDDRDTVANARAFKSRYQARMPGAEAAHWRFLTGDRASLNRLADAAGFAFKYDAKSGEYAHNAAVIFVNANGLITRYLYGITYEPFALKMGVLETQANRLNSAVERVLLFCYNYDPESNAYVLYAVNLMKIGGLMTILAIAFLIFFLKKQEHKQMKQEAQ